MLLIVIDKSRPPFPKRPNDKQLVPGFGFCVVIFDELPTHRSSPLRPKDSHVKEENSQGIRA